MNDREDVQSQSLSNKKAWEACGPYSGPFGKDAGHKRPRFHLETARTLKLANAGERGRRKRKWLLRGTGWSPFRWSPETVPVLHNSKTVNKVTTGKGCVAHSGEKKKSVSTVVIKLPQIQRCKTIKLYYGAFAQDRRLTTFPQTETRKSSNNKKSDTQGKETLSLTFPAPINCSCIKVHHSTSTKS